MRLNKILAQAGLASRRGSDRLIAEGRVTINGTVVTEPGTIADPTRDEIAVDGRPIPRPQAKQYLLLHKPRGYLTSRHDPRGRPIVFDLISDTGARLFPVGRLDFDSEGLLLLTNDGALAHRLLHPRYGIPRVYEAEVEGRVSEPDLQRFRQGVVLEDGVATPAAVRLLRRTLETTWLELTFAEGRYREVRRFCAALGYHVVRLRRVRLGPLRLGRLAPGAARPLTEREIRELRALAPALASQA
jgi:pseudouridine synthase